ncbi:MAG: alpha/beta hydrolase [Spirochaetaceae bacterium]|nr:hypothetical protein [Myxococcales bacterium]MCB9724189.1 alpha/beta hydrolase [Spirochaetaceae bacterium]
MLEQPRWSKWSLPGLAAGGLWTAQALALGGLLSIGPWIIGAALLASGFSLLVWPGDTRITQTGALAGGAGALLSLPLAFVLGPLAGLALLASALFAAWGSGRMALQLEPRVPGVPAVRPSAGLAAKVALDEIVLGFEQWGATGFALDGTVERVIDEVERTHELFAERGLLDKPETYHVRPPDLVDPEIRRERIRGREIEILRFESGYAPAAGEPGRERWLGYDPCRDGWAYVLRHPEAASGAARPRPWLICTNGYRMGHAWADVGLFERFHAKLGANLLIPVLPLHGPRRIGWHSGSGFLGLDVIDTLHAEAQAMWDMRRLLSWVRAQEPSAIGAFGLSLGGYTTALFSCLAEALDCVVAGIPVTDFTRILRRHATPHQLRYAQSLGLDLERIGEVLRVVSPLVLEPEVPVSGRLIFGATADRLVTPDQVRDLWRHWQEPEIVWYEGVHVSFMSEPAVWAAVDRVLSENGVRAR